MNLPPRTLGGGLYGGAYLFLNFLREAYDIILVLLDEEAGDVGKNVLNESDWLVLAGGSSGRSAFDSKVKALGPTADPGKMLLAWLGAIQAEDREILAGYSVHKIIWADSVASLFEKTGSPYEALESCPKARDGIGRLARHLGGIKVGVALGTGAALGYSLIGILKVFKREMIPIDMLAGTSMGSLIAGLAAMGLEPEEIEEIALRIDKPWVYRNLFLDLVLPSSGFFGGQTLLRFLREQFKDKEFRDLAIPFACAATDIETGAEVVLKRGMVAEAVRASCGLPLIFAPFKLFNRYLVDGGLINPVPTSVIADMGADVLIAVNLTEPPSPEGKKRRARIKNVQQLANTPVNWESIKEIALPAALKAPSLLSIFFRMIYTMEYEIARSKATPAHVNIEPDLKGFSWTDLHKAKEIINAGELIAEPYVAQIKAQLPYFSDRCKVNLRLASPIK